MRTKTKGKNSRDKSKARAVWTTSDETTLIHFLLERKAEAGNDFTFNTATWQAAASRIERHREKGGVKGALGCKKRWVQLCNTFRIVDTVMQHFVFSWNSEHGANIDTRLEDLWATYIEKHPEASPFRNKGWPHYHDMLNLIPTTNDRQRKLAEENANKSSYNAGNGPPMSSQKRQHSEISDEDSLDSSVYVVIAEVVATVLRGVQFILDDDDFPETGLLDVESPNPINDGEWP